MRFPFFPKAKSDHAELTSMLEKYVAADNSLRPLEQRPDSDYGIIYGFDFTPCCYPLQCLAWINPTTPGLFLRCFIGIAMDEASQSRVGECIGPINYSLPAGSFALDSASGDVLFKNAVYFGGQTLSPALVRGLFESSFEFVTMHWQSVLNAIFGTTVGIHNH